MVVPQAEAAAPLDVEFHPVLEFRRLYVFGRLFVLQRYPRDDEVLAVDWLSLHRARALLVDDYRRVERAAFDCLVHHVGRVRNYSEIDGRLVFEQRAVDGRQKAAVDALGAADRKSVGRAGRASVRYLAADLLPFESEGQKALPRRSKLDGFHTLLPVDQNHAHVVLELVEVVAYRGLRDAQQLRGFSESPRHGDGEKGLYPFFMQQRSHPSCNSSCAPLRIARGA